MVAAFDYCLHGKGGAAPSIDTAMHGLVDAAHVDHLHPDSGIAIATAADGEELTTDDLRRPRRVGAVAPSRLPARPRHRRDQGEEPAGRSAASSAATASPRGATPARSPRPTRSGSSTPPPTYIAEHTKAEPFGPALEGYAALPEAERRAKAAALAPTIRGIASPDRPMVGHFTDADVVLDFLGARRAPAPGRARHLVPRPLPAHQGQAAGARPARHRLGRGERSPASRSCTSPTARTTRATTTATPTPTAPRSAAPTR